MKLFISNEYKSKKDKIKGKELTDAFIRDCINDQRAEILRNEEGKPHIEGGPCFSVSHSRDTIAIIFSNATVGIDLQYSKNIDAHKLAKRYYSENEKKLVEEDTNNFFVLWTKKEAYAKYTGRGLAQILDKTEVIAREDVIFKNCNPMEDCFLSICIGRDREAEDIEIIRLGS